MTTKTRRFMVSFRLDVPEHWSLDKAATPADISDEIIAWFEDLWCTVDEVGVQEVEYPEEEKPCQMH